MYNLPPGHNGGKITDHNVKYWNFVSFVNCFIELYPLGCDGSEVIIGLEKGFVSNRRQAII